MAIQFSNLASTTLASGVSSSATSVSVTSASSFPTLGSGDYFYATIGAGSGSEIVKVTGISGTTFTVLRGQDDTTAVSHSSGADVALRVTAGALADLRDGGQVYTAGSGLGLSGNEFTNTAPDQTVALTGAGTTSVSGTYPNFTITGAGTTYTAGSGLSLTGTEFANTAPDQTVALTGAGATSISGTYPNFTITSTDTDTVYTLPFTDNSTNWNTAYGWGDHSAAGYLTSHQSLSGYATETYVGTQISNLVDSSPATMDTLNELAAALGDDPNFATTVSTSIGTKLPLAGGTLTGALSGTTATFSGSVTAPSIRASSGDFHVNRGSDGASAIRVDADGVVVIPSNYFYVPASQGSYFSSAVRFRGTISNDTGTDVTIGDTLNVTGGIKLNGTTVIDASRNLTNIGTISSGAITSSGNITIAKQTPLLTIETASNSTNPELRLKSSGVFSNEGFGIYYDNNAGDAHFQTTYADNAASIKFYTATGGSPTASNLRFEIGGDGNFDFNGGNFSDVGTISSGAQALVANATIIESLRNPSTSWGEYALTRYGTEGANFRYMDFGYYRGTTEATRGLVIKSQAFSTLFTFLDSGEFQVGTTTVIDSSRNLTNISNAYLTNGGALHTYTSSGTLRGYIGAVESGGGTAAGLVIATSGGETISFKDGGLSGTLNAQITGGGDLNLITGTLDINGTTVITSNRLLENVTLETGASGARFKTNAWHQDSGGRNRFYFEHTGRTYFQSGGGYVFRNSSDDGRATISSDGCLNLQSGSDGFVGSTVALAVGGTTVIDSSRNLTNIGTLNGGTAWRSNNDGSGSGLDADLLDGQHGSYYYSAGNPAPNQTITLSGAVTGSGTTSIGTSNPYQTSVTFSTNGPDSVMEYQQAASITDTKLAPSADWYHSIRMGHGDPYSYYSNTMAMKMTGTGSGTLYTQVISNNSAGGWNKYWHTNNDGSGSGLDADLLDGINSTSFLRSDANDTATGSITFSQASQYFRKNAQTNYVSASLLAESYGGGATRTGVGFHISGSIGKWVNMDASGVLRWDSDTFWHSGNDGSGSGLDADLLDGQHGSYYAPATGGSYLPLAGGTLTGNLNLSGSTNSIIIGGAAHLNAFNSVSATTGLTFGGGSDFNNYSIGTSTQNIGGNYTKLNIKWHTGIRFFSMPQYGGTRFYSDAAMNTETFSINNSDGNVRAANSLYANDVRASIFYDSNNTGYYVDPSANSYLLGATYGGLSIGEAPTNYDGWDKQLNVNGSGHARIHVKTTAGRRMGIYAHDTWHNGGGGYVGTYSNHNVTFVQNAVSAGYIDTGKNLIWQGSSVRASIFYDSDNTGFYFDGSSPGTSVRISGDVLIDQQYGKGVVGVYSSTVLQHVWSMGAAYRISANGASAGNMYGLAWSHPNAGSLGGAGHLNDHGLLLINNGGFRAAISSRAVFSADVRGTEFYDYNDTGYYVNPSSNGGASLVSIGDWRQASGTWSGEVAGKMQYHSNNWYIQYSTETIFRNASAVNTMIMTASGDMTVHSSSRAPIFYDSNDTGYYVDPHNISAIRRLTLASSATTTFATPNVMSYASSNTAGAAQYHIRFVANNGNTNGSISTNYYQTTYATTSDYRVKEDFQSIINATSRLMSLNPVNFQWKDSDMRTDGFLAHEVAEVVSDAVVGEKDAVDEKGNDELQSLDQSKLVPLLVKTIQEQQGVIEALEARISALEA